MRFLDENWFGDEEVVRLELEEHLIRLTFVNGHLDFWAPFGIAYENRTSVCNPTDKTGSLELLSTFLQKTVARHSDRQAGQEIRIEMENGTQITCQVIADTLRGELWLHRTTSEGEPALFVQEF